MTEWGSVMDDQCEMDTVMDDQCEMDVEQFVEDVIDKLSSARSRANAIENRTAIVSALSALPQSALRAASSDARAAVGAALEPVLGPMRHAFLVQISLLVQTLNPTDQAPPRPTAKRRRTAKANSMQNQRPLEGFSGGGRQLDDDFDGFSGEGDGGGGQLDDDFDGCSGDESKK